MGWRVKINKEVENRVEFKYLKLILAEGDYSFLSDKAAAYACSTEHTLQLLLVMIQRYPRPPMWPKKMMKLKPGIIDYVIINSVIGYTIIIIQLCI